ncbi:MAG: DUF1236 domain-containing protein [Xanthobacteraceae bacterium]
MRTNILYASAAVAAILAGASLASGQGVNEPHKGAAQHDQTRTVGQSPGTEQRREGGPAAAQHQGTGSGPAAAQRQERGTTGQASGERQQLREEKGQGGRPAAQQQRPATTGQAPGTEPRNGGMQRQAPRGETEGKGSGAAANLSTEQRTRIRETVLKESNAPRVARANFSVSVGTVVPDTVHYVGLPAPIVEIYPAWRGYDFFLVGDEIVIVDPRDHRIVAVLEA